MRYNYSKSLLVIYFLSVVTMFTGISCSKELVSGNDKDDFNGEGTAIALTGGKIIDGTGNSRVENGLLLVNDGKIAFVGSGDQKQILESFRVINVNGCTVLPGFINAHIHHGYSESDLKKWAWNGVTTVRDLAANGPNTDLKELIKFRDRVNSNPNCARLVSAGFILAKKNGYCSSYYNSFNSPKEARQLVINEINAGVEIIKFALEDGYAGVTNLPNATDNEMSAIVNTAHEYNTPVSVHITDSKYLQKVIDLGVDDVAHITWNVVDPEIYKEMVAKNIYMVPTVTVFNFYGSPINNCITNIRNFVNVGGKIALGNDYDNGYPAGYFELGIPMYEVQCMKDADMTPMQIIEACTKNAAHVSNIINETGTLEAGKDADVLIVDGDPLKNLQTLKDIKMVIHRGVIIRDEL